LISSSILDKFSLLLFGWAVQNPHLKIDCNVRENCEVGKIWVIRIIFRAIHIFYALIFTPSPQPITGSPSMLNKIEKAGAAFFTSHMFHYPHFSFYYPQKKIK